MQKGLGRGLDALFDGAAKNEKNIIPQKLPIDSLIPNPGQPRRIFEEKSLKELADSILAQGILQPILVRPDGDGRYQIVAGERRWRAAALAGLTLVPVIVKELEDSEAMAVALIENLQREDLNPLEEAQALASLKETLQISQDELASRLGKSRPAIANSIRLLQLSAQAQEDLARGKLSAGHARCLLGIGDAAQAEDLRQKIIDAGMTVRESEKAAAAYRLEGRFPWQKTEPEKREGKGKISEKNGKEALWLELENRIGDRLGCAVRIRGDETRGRISLSFESNSELCNILQNFGIEFEEAAKNA